MKKKILLAFLSTIVLFGCDKNKGSTSEPNDEPHIIESKWGQQYNEVMTALGTDIPFIECDSFQIVTGTDDFGDPTVNIYCVYDEKLIQSKMDEYANICEDEGYHVEFATYGDLTYQFDLYVADKVVNSTTGVQLQILEGALNGVEMMGIFAFNYPYDDPSAWPTNLVTKLLGHDVPHIEMKEGYECSAKINSDTYGIYIDMIIYNVGGDTEDELYTLLSQNGYTLDDSEYYEYGYYAYSPDFDYVIQFKFTQYGLEIFIFEI